MITYAAGDVAIDATNFPDETFKMHVLGYIDTNRDSKLDANEIMACTSINCSWKGISNLKGIEFFTRLTSLECDHNDLSSLDISKNTMLTSLDCSHTYLNSIDVSKNKALKRLTCEKIGLTSLDVSKNRLLTGLHCGGNLLSSLDVSKNTALEWLTCGENNLSSLDISKNTKLERLICDSNVNISLNKGSSVFLYACNGGACSSSNAAIASVDNNGKITGKKVGTATITVKTSTPDGEQTENYKITVKSPASQNTGRFSDVKKTDWYYSAVEWAAAQGIATGSNGKFNPAQSCTREQAITFLWRMAGKPEPKSMKSKFSDVKDTKSYSYKAIMWGNEKGLIFGSKGKFNPKGTCTREQIVTMIWRMAGKPNPKTTTSKFKDVKNKKSYSYKAILWANEKGIAKGTNGKFSPTLKCKRRDIVTFIYRYKN